MKKIATFLVITALLLSGCNGIPSFSNVKDVTSTTNTKKTSTKSSEKYDTITYGEKTIKFNKMEATILKPDPNYNPNENTFEVTGEVKEKIISSLKENLTNEIVNSPLKNDDVIGVRLILSNSTEKIYLTFNPENKINGQYYVIISQNNNHDYLFIKTDLSKKIPPILK